MVNGCRNPSLWQERSRTAKFWLIPDVALAKGRSGGLSGRDLRAAAKLIEDNRDMILGE